LDFIVCLDGLIAILFVVVVFITQLEHSNALYVLQVHTSLRVILNTTAIPVLVVNIRKQIFATVIINAIVGILHRVDYQPVFLRLQDIMPPVMFHLILIPLLVQPISILIQAIQCAIQIVIAGFIILQAQVNVYLALQVRIAIAVLTLLQLLALLYLLATGHHNNLVVIISAL
jgi:hypothetical protein